MIPHHAAESERNPSPDGVLYPITYSSRCYATPRYNDLREITCACEAVFYVCNDGGPLDGHASLYSDDFTSTFIPYTNECGDLYCARSCEAAE